jgi:hypothetical protein
MLFATTFILEREPLRWADLPHVLAVWVQTVGGLAALGAFLWFLVVYAQNRGEKERVPTVLPAVVALALSWLGFLAAGGMFVLYWMGVAGLEQHLPTQYGLITAGDYILTAAGALAFLTVLAPLLIAVVTRLAGRRIWAMARLSLKEAVRSRVVLIFGAMALIFLFADWFVPYKPEDQVRNYVRVLYWSMAPLFLMTASLLGAFGIPTDVKNQSIHTIVTKPVEKFEVVLGRFLGYAVVITLGLAAVAAVSMLYIFRGVTPEAEKESFTARVPVYARQPPVFVGTEKETGDNVGRMFAYRGYIGGQPSSAPNTPRQYAIYRFDEFPDNVAARVQSGEAVRFEFTFDIFRLTKGQEDRGVFCSFLFMPGTMTVGEGERALEALKRQRDQRREQARKQFGTGSEAYDKREKEIDTELIDQFAVLEVSGIEVKDYHTLAITTPPALFKALEKAAADAPEPGPNEPTNPLFQVVVSVERSSQQMLGMARFDFYLLAGERDFFMNFAKGIIGMWCLTMLILGVAVGCSTYLSGVISWLVTVFLLLAGIFVADIHLLAEGRSEGGGPIEAAMRLFKRQAPAVPLDDNPVAAVVTGADEIYRWWLRRFLNLVPDVTRYDLHHYVANGFDISWSRVLLLDNVLPLLGYLIPWAILAFYLMKYREIANPM